MPQVIVSLLAQADTASIVTDLVSNAGYRVAVRYAADFEALYDRLSLYPGSGSPRPAIGSRIRIGLVWPYIVIYRHDRTKDTVTIARIVHGKRKITGKLLRGD